MVMKLENYNFFVKVEAGKLLRCKTEPDGTVKDIEWKEVTKPDQAFIDAANHSLGTEFTLADFEIKIKASGDE